MNTLHTAASTPLDRRTFLKATRPAHVAPFLESVLARLGAEAAEPDALRRFVGMMANMESCLSSFFKQTPGKACESTPYLDLLNARRSDLRALG